MSKNRIKQYLMLLTVVGLVAIAAGGGNGTFASFNAEVTNAGNTFAAGTLFLHDNGGTSTCTSESSSDNLSTNNCDVLFNNIDLTNTSGSTADLTLSNAGKLAASDIKFKVGNCTVADNHGVTGVTTVFGTAPTCAQMYITVQETQSDFTTPVYCAYGSATATCAAPSSSYTLGNTTSLTTLKTTGGTTASFAAPPAAGATRYYAITVTPGGVTNDNSLQNRKISFDLTWHIDQ